MVRCSDIGDKFREIFAVLSCSVRESICKHLFGWAEIYSSNKIATIEWNRSNFVLAIIS